MKTHFWIGSENGSFIHDANWSNGRVPLDGDTIIFDGRAGKCDSESEYQVIGQQWRCTSGLDQSTKKFDQIIIDEAYTGNIGIGFDTPTAGESALECAANKIIIRGLGLYYIMAKSTTARNIDQVEVNTVSGSVYMGKAYQDGSSISKVTNFRGVLEVLGATGGTAAKDLADPDVREIVNVGSAASTTINKDNYHSLIGAMYDGVLILNSGFTELEVSGGQVFLGPANRRSPVRPVQFRILWTFRFDRRHGRTDGNCFANIHAEEIVSRCSYHPLDRPAGQIESLTGQ